MSPKFRRVKYPQLTDKDWLAREYGEKRRSIEDIAAELGCSAALVDLRLRQFGIPRRGRGERMFIRDKACERCGNAYTPVGPAQRLCDDCWSIKTCECGAEFTIGKEERTAARGTRKYCDPCTAVKRGSTKTRQAIAAGGTMRRRVHKFGYVEINLGYQPAPDDGRIVGPSGRLVTRMVGDKGYIHLGRVKEHHWVMEQRIGRRLLPHENVHHKNGDRQDNDLCPNCPVGTKPPEIRKNRLRCKSCGWVSRTPPNLELWTKSQPNGQRVEDKIEWALAFLAEYGRVSFQSALPDDAAA